MEEEQKYHWRARYVSALYDSNPDTVREVGRVKWVLICLFLSFILGVWDVPRWSGIYDWMTMSYASLHFDLVHKQTSFVAEKGSSRRCGRSHTTPRLKLIRRTRDEASSISYEATRSDFDIRTC